MLRESHPPVGGLGGVALPTAQPEVMAIQRSGRQRGSLLGVRGRQRLCGRGRRLTGVGRLRLDDIASEVICCWLRRTLVLVVIVVVIHEALGLGLEDAQRATGAASQVGKLLGAEQEDHDQAR